MPSPHPCWEAGSLRLPLESGQQVLFLRRKRRGCAHSPGISALLRRREGRAAPPETAPRAERRPLEVLGVQGKDGGVLGVGDPETLHLLVIKRKGREESCYQVQGNSFVWGQQTGISSSGTTGNSTNALTPCPVLVRGKDSAVFIFQVLFVIG